MRSCDFGERIPFAEIRKGRAVGFSVGRCADGRAPTEQPADGRVPVSVVHHARRSIRGAGECQRAPTEISTIATVRRPSLDNPEGGEMDVVEGELSVAASFGDTVERTVALISAGEIVRIR